MRSKRAWATLASASRSSTSPRASGRPAEAVFSAFAGTVLSIGSGIADVLVVIVAGIFLATQPRFYLTGAVKLIPPGKRPLALESIMESERRCGCGCAAS